VANGAIEHLGRAGLEAAGPEEATGDVVVVVSGGNNDVSRYNEIVERSLVHEGLKHYFLVTFPQEPGALRRFLDRVLGPDDDIVLFDYIKRNNREVGPALVGLEIGDRGDLEPLMARMAACNMTIARVDGGADDVVQDVGGLPVLLAGEARAGAYQASRVPGTGLTDPGRDLDALRTGDRVDHLEHAGSLTCPDVEGAVRALLAAQVV